MEPVHIIKRVEAGLPYPIYINVFNGRLSVAVKAKVYPFILKGDCAQFSCKLSIAPHSMIEPMAITVNECQCTVTPNRYPVPVRAAQIERADQIAEQLAQELFQQIKNNALEPQRVADHFVTLINHREYQKARELVALTPSLLQAVNDDNTLILEYVCTHAKQTLMETIFKIHAHYQNVDSGRNCPDDILLLRELFCKLGFSDVLSLEGGKGVLSGMKHLNIFMQRLCDGEPAILVCRTTRPRPTIIAQVRQNEARRAAKSRVSTGVL